MQNYQNIDALDEFEFPPILTAPTRVGYIASNICLSLVNLQRPLPHFLTGVDIETHVVELQGRTHGLQLPHEGNLVQGSICPQRQEGVI